MAGYSGNMGVSMVNFAIKLTPSVGETFSKGKMHNVHSKCQSQLKQPKQCPTCSASVVSQEGELVTVPYLVPSEEIIKGFSISKTELVILTPEELEQVPLPSKRSITFDAFTSVENVSDPRLGEKVYIITPGDDKPNTSKAFSLFNWVLNELNVVGISKISFSTEEHLCAVYSGEHFPEFAGKGIMVLQLLVWSSQVRELPKGVAVAIQDKEKMLVKTLISQYLTESVAWENYRDDYDTSVLDIVERKRAGEDVSIPLPVEKAEDTSLMDMLMASVGKK